MQGVMKIAALWSLLVFGACYRPNIANQMYRCPPEAPACPEGFVCVEGFCEIPQIRLDLGPGGDMTGDQLFSPADLPPAPDFSMGNGCAAKNGAHVGANAWACPGKWALGGARSQCAASYHVCRNAASLDLSACRLVTGFFLADSRGYDSFRDCTKSTAAVTCGYFTNADRPFWFGCGSSRSSVQDCLRGCDGFTQGLNGSFVEKEPGKPFVDGFTSSMDDTINNDPLIGVLCCHD